MLISIEFSKKLKNTLTRLKPEQADLFIPRIEKFFEGLKKNQIIYFGDFITATGLDRKSTSILLADLSFSSNPQIKPVTIPFADGKFWEPIKVDGLEFDPSAFEIYSEEREEFLTEKDIELVAAYEVCND